MKARGHPRDCVLQPPRPFQRLSSQRCQGQGLQRPLQRLQTPMLSSGPAQHASPAGRTGSTTAWASMATSAVMHHGPRSPCLPFEYPTTDLQIVPCLNHLDAPHVLSQFVSCVLQLALRHQCWHFRGKPLPDTACLALPPWCNQATLDALRGRRKGHAGPRLSTCMRGCFRARHVRVACSAAPAASAANPGGRANQQLEPADAPAASAANPGPPLWLA